MSVLAVSAPEVEPQLGVEQPAHVREPVPAREVCVSGPEDALDVDAVDTDGDPRVRGFTDDLHVGVREGAKQVTDLAHTPALR